ncbi:hypothetical protein CC86DRAFT_279968 [Ophiobolus disseminans]|uniref:Uncharacterized protein n=1 Tax=Ophiobolus disseminans TaxID=1469910 RepID=A0A6A7AGN5_9PLEO|nr:hypothetical protein CC86DRAFT_279968 [Ophiobolus disseminans]
MFKNESDVVAKKAEKRYEVLARQKIPIASKRHQGSLPDFDFTESWKINYDWKPEQTTTHTIPYTCYSTPESMPREAVVPSIEDQALGFFIGNYVAKPTIVPRGQFEWIPELLAQSNTEEIFRSSVNAASLAAFANATKSPGIMRQAQAAYSNLGRRLFHQYYGVILLVSLETGRAVPPGMYDLYQTMNPTSDYSVHGRQWTTRMINVLHDAITLNQDRHTDPRTMVSTALSIDRELDELKRLMPHVWNHKTIHLEQPSEYLYGDTYDFYLDPWIVQMWNNVKSCRMYLYKIVRENLVRGYTHLDQPLFSRDEYESTQATAKGIVQSTTASIIASIPQITGMIPFPDLSTARRRASHPELDGDEPSPVFTVQPPGTFLDPSQSTQIVHVIWPLYAVGQTDLATAELRQWVIDMLHFVALRIGTRQAVVLADELKALQRTVLPVT